MFNFNIEREITKNNVINTLSCFSVVIIAPYLLKVGNFNIDCLPDKIWVYNTKTCKQEFIFTSQELIKSLNS
jgi:hypothetical protein